MTVPSPRRSSSCAAAASTSFAFVATITSSASANPAGSVDARGWPTKSARPETRMPFSATVAACSGRRHTSVTSATRERWAAKRLPMTPPPITHTFTVSRRRAGTIDERGLVIDFPSLTVGEGLAQRRPGCRLDRKDPCLGPQRLDRARDPDAETAAAEGNEHRVGARKVLQDFEPNRPVTRHHLLVLDRMDEDAVDLVEARFLDRLPPTLVRHLDHATSKALDRRQLRLCRALGNDDSALNLELARGPSDALAHVPGARRHHALPQLGRLQLQDRVQRSAKLERADRLQVLELQVDRRRRI